ncbi:DNA-nicking Smr family endonuclease [Aeromonas sp. BIGb0405]|uniref:endonuclease SmrB n=1 Tax=Aeromonas sp. BIGb0405 TaxID=2940592 RepID=UPI00216A559B|nr:endonuclease SmrB [Aeromonas sp. BIGb0405]MCS3455919.1 DNA-nicking Smr family endonuclease [Aeromonas sp. BIGb0405]
MKKTPSLTSDESQLFRDAIKGTRKIKQDTLRAELRPVKQKREMRESREMLGVGHFFSDEYQPHLDEEGPTRYVREDVSKFELKKLKRGLYPPEIYLDLHGMNQNQAKQELAALLSLCQKENIHVASVMHGIGKHILKQRIPNWLAQHPHVQAFHQAPREWGGDSAILVLLDIEE